jgi:glycosyltransferase involved in cell wall biosynthesis
MRILMLAQFYPPTIGGEERHVRNLSQALTRRGHDVAVATLWNEGLAEHDHDGDVRVHRIRSTTQRARWLFSEGGRRHAPPFPDPGALMGLRAVVTQEKPDLVHAHNWLLHSYLPLKAWSGVPLVVTLHDYSLLCAKKRLMYEGAPCSGPGLVKCLKCASNHYGLLKGPPTVLANWASGAVEKAVVDRFLAVSEATAAGNGLIGSGLPYQVVPNFIPDDVGMERVSADERLEQLPRDDFLLFVGDLSHDKGVDVLARAYAGMRDVPPLVLIGRATADTPRSFPSNVTVINDWPHALVMEAWHRCTLGLVPSTWHEPCGTVALEAMATGKPVIASRMGGLNDIVAPGETGLLVPPEDEAALREAIMQLLANPEEAQRMGQAGKRRVTCFQASTVVSQIEAVYEEVLRGKLQPAAEGRL